MTTLKSADKESVAIGKLRERMQAYQPGSLPLPLPQAAVLMPITRQPEPELILTVRAKTMPTHAGEVAFPGGRHARGESIRQTALRETQEEVGIAPADVEMLGQLTPLASKYGLKVTPFVGLIDSDTSLVADPGEIAEIFRVPLSFFLQQAPELSQPINFFGKRWRIPSYSFEGKRIWGLTAFMIVDLMNFTFDADISLA